MHASRMSMITVSLLMSAIILSGCGGGEARMPSGGGIGARQAASDELRAGEDTVFGRLFDSYSPPATSLKTSSAGDPLSAAYDPSMLSASNLDTLDLDPDALSTLETADIGSFDDAATTFNAAWSADGPTYGSTGSMMNVASLTSGMPGMDDPAMDDPELDAPVDDSMLDAQDMAMEDGLDAQDAELSLGDF